MCASEVMTLSVQAMGDGRGAFRFMQSFSIRSAMCNSVPLPTPPKALAEAADNFSTATGCEFPDALAVCLSVFAGTAGPCFATITPRGRRISSAFNALVVVPPGKNIATALAEIRAPLDNAFADQLSKRLAIGNNRIENHIRQTRSVLDDLRSKRLPDIALGGLGRRPAMEAHARHKAELEAAERERVVAEFLRRPWITTDSIEQLTSIADGSFDHGMFLQIEAEAAFVAVNESSEIARIILNGFCGTGFSLDPNRHILPTVSNLWTTPQFLHTLLEPPALQTFVVAEIAGAVGRCDSMLANWSTLLATAFASRIRFARDEIRLSDDAAAIYLDHEDAWRCEIAPAAPAVFPALTHVPVQALKIALYFHLAMCVENEQFPAEIDANCIEAGFAFAEFFGRRLRDRRPATAPAIEIDIGHLINRLAVRGPMKMRDLQRTYHKARLSDVNAWIAEGVRRGKIRVDRNLVVLSEPDVSVSACQQPERSEIHA
ncbi:MAG: hypothetical protein RL088_213 [Verrucomicrobiota bacterium]